MLKRVLIFIFITVFMMLYAMSCGDGGEAPDNDNGGAVESENLREAEEQLPENSRDIPDGLPEVNLGGRSFNILCHEMLTVEFVAEEEIGDTVNDALYARNLAVAERFNADLNVIQIPGAWGDRDSFMGTVRNAVLAGEAAYDLVAGVTSYIPNLVPQGIFLDINTVDYVDFTKPWWGEDWVRELSIGSRLFLVTGDVALSMWDCMFVFYFNKQLAVDHDLPDLYEAVKKGEWTFDKFTELSRTVSADLDGDGRFDENDMFGFVTTTGTVVNAFPGGFDMAITYKDADNVPHPQLDTEKWSEAAVSLYELHHRTQSTLTLPDGADYDTIVPMFQANRALFFPQTLSFARDLRAMETDFGILPFPKYDTSQNTYCAVVRNAASLLGIPASVSNPHESGLIMEALAAESYRVVIPAYYDVSLKVKQARDEESGEMLDIIRDNLWMNFGYSYSLSTGSIGNYMREMIDWRGPNFASLYESDFERRADEFNRFIDDVLNLE
ncbi:MAG: extracellular solute-binding protein [Oscillospiraceae bacterium]|nr:extracellular solute-binding protein [Oscillospiraceae bacterium]